MTRAEHAAAIMAAIARMSDGDVAIVAAALNLGSPSELAAGGPSAPVDLRREYGTVVLDPRPDAYSGTCAQALALYRAVATLRGLAPLL